MYHAYHTEEFQDMTTTEEYLKNHEGGAGFLEYCEKWMGCERIWSCPLYDFNPLELGECHKYFYIFGRKLIFEQADVCTGKRKANEKERERERERERAEKRERERYMKQICSQEQNALSEKVQALEDKYPGSLALPAGNCHVCSRCKRPEIGGCRYSDDIRYFIESLGGNVGETVGGLLGIELQWRKKNLPDSFTVINGFLTNDPNVLNLSGRKKFPPVNNF